MEVEMIEKLHAVVARSTFRSQNVTKHNILGPLFARSDVEKMHAVAGARDCAPCRRVKMYKAQT